MAASLNSSRPWRVVITRPKAQAEPWAAQLQARGFTAELLELLAICPLVGADQQRAIQNRVLDFDLYQKAIFVSQNAVRYGLEWLDKYWPQLPIGIEYFAVGAATARGLLNEGLAVEDLAQSESGSMTSEALLQSPALQQVAGEKIVIFRGLGGRGHLAEILRERGAQVDYCEVYQRQLPEAAPGQLQLLLNKRQEWQKYTNVMALHSGESLQNLQHLISQLPRDLAELLRQSYLLVPSERVAQLAGQAGFAAVLCATNATDGAMTQALIDARSQSLSS